MRSLAVIVPVKSTDAKSRLSPVLTYGERRDLSMALLRGVLASLTRAGIAGDCRVVSHDREALELAIGCGARPVEERADSGVNAAVRAGMGDAAGASDILVVPSDLPLLKASDVLDILRLRSEGMSVVLSPSSAFDGTNALLFPNDGRFPLSFDTDSFWNHLAAAGKLGVPVGVCAREGTMFDVDTPQDLRKLAISGRGVPGVALARRRAP